MATRRKHQQSKRSRYHPRKTARRMRNLLPKARGKVHQIGVLENKIAEIEEREHSAEARRSEQCRDAEDRSKYHELRLSYLGKSVV